MRGLRHHAANIKGLGSTVSWRSTALPRRSHHQLQIYPLQPHLATSSFSTSCRHNIERSITDLQPRGPVNFLETSENAPLHLQWTQPPQNILLIKKDSTVETTEALQEFASHVKSTYPSTNIIVEPLVAAEIAPSLPFDIFSTKNLPKPNDQYQAKTDLVTTFGGDGTILHAASLFAAANYVPPILSFSMGTLGFLGEWKFSEYKRAFREVYMSGATSERQAIIQDTPHPNPPSSSSTTTTTTTTTGWSSLRGKSLGSTRPARLLIRQRLKIAIFDSLGTRLPPLNDMHAMNEIILHRGRDPHLAVVSISVSNRFLTEAVADGIIISTPTGSTAYSLSAGGSIIHPAVPSLLLTPICARSLSFRPLVLPANTPVTLKLSEKNRGREVELSVDGERRMNQGGIGVGMEVRVWGEEILKQNGKWTGGIPCVLRQSQRGSGGVAGGGGSRGEAGDDGWVGGLNGLLKFNYPFGEED